MVIILPLGATVKQYLQWAADSSKNLILSCPACSEKRLHRHDQYQRSAVTRTVLYRVPVFRWHCPRCGQTVSVLPDFLVPYGQFVNSLRERAVRLVVGGLTLAKVALKISSPAVSVVSTRTIRRWVARGGEVRRLFEQLAGRPYSDTCPSLGSLRPHPPAPRFPSRPALFAHLGFWWCRLFEQPVNAHPGFFAALSRCRSAPGLL